MKQLINKWLKNSHLLNYTPSLSHLKQAIFRQNCVLCNAYINTSGAKIHTVCRPCLDDLPWHAKKACPQCGLVSGGLESSGQLCGCCISSPPDFDATHTVFLYQFPIDAMMQRYKYGNSLNLGDTFGQLLGEKINAENRYKDIDLIIPMPMHPARIKERGFNQALELAKVLIKNIKEKHGDAKLDYTSTIRQKLTPPQASLPLKERVKNIKDAFKVKDDRRFQIQGKAIAIVDDVMTSGASLNELAKTLKKAGAARVECWVIARTLPHK